MDQMWNPNAPPLKKPLVVIGGQCGRVGKTLLSTQLISTLSEVEWTAVKVTPHAESRCPISGPECDCGPNEHVVAIHEEHDRTGASDTSRFLAAGARKAFWVEVKNDRLQEALPAVTAALGSAEHVVIESSAILQFWRPAMLLVVLDPAKRDFKASAKHAITLADAFVFRSPLSESKPYDPMFASLPAKPTFLQPLGEPFPSGVESLARQLLGLPAHPVDAQVWRDVPL
jgi:hypothetical protein